MQEIQLRDLLPDVITYNALITACNKDADPTRASELFGKMLSRGLRPTVITYSALINACAKGMAPERALVLFDEM